MATASALTNTFSDPGKLITENFSDLMDVRFKDIADEIWGFQPEGLKYWVEEDTNRKYEKYSAMTGGEIVPKSRDIDPMPKSNVLQGFDYEIEPEVYRQSIEVEERLLETDQFRVIQGKFKALNQNAKDTIELYAARPFNTAFSATVDFLAADGMNIIDTDRPYEDAAAGTYDNEDSSGALTQSTVGTMRLNFAKTKGPRGRVRPIRMEKLVIPADLEDTAITELGSALKPGSSLNDKNYLTEYNLSYEVWHYLTSTAYFFGMGPKDMCQLKWLWGKRPMSGKLMLENPNVYGRYIRFVFKQGAGRMHALRGNQGS